MEYKMSLLGSEGVSLGLPRRMTVHLIESRDITLVYRGPGGELMKMDPKHHYELSIEKSTRRRLHWVCVPHASPDFDGSAFEENYSMGNEIFESMSAEHIARVYADSSCPVRPFVLTRRVDDEFDEQRKIAENSRLDKELFELL